MQQLDVFLAFLAYCKRVFLQFLNIKNLNYFYLIFKGFTPDKGYFYDFKKYNQKDFIPDSIRYVNQQFINYKFKELFRDKYTNFLFLEQFTENLVPIYALIEEGQCYFVNQYKSLNELFAAEKKFVIKPRKGRGGQGVCVLEIKEDVCYFNGFPRTVNQLFNDCDDCILVPFVIQHGYSAAIHAKSLNTIRLLTCVLNDEIEIIGAIHRFGSSTTGNVDNFSQGGISAKINVNTGIIDQACIISKKNLTKRFITHHPDSHQEIVGLGIPDWNKMKQEMIKLHAAIKYVRYIGWDIAITPAGYQIIESNHVSDVDVFQVHEPLLLHDKARSFYATVS